MWQQLKNNSKLPFLFYGAAVAALVWHGFSQENGAGGAKMAAQLMSKITPAWTSRLTTVSPQLAISAKLDSLSIDRQFVYRSPVEILHDNLFSDQGMVRSLREKFERAAYQQEAALAWSRSSELHQRAYAQQMNSMAKEAVSSLRKHYSVSKINHLKKKAVEAGVAAPIAVGAVGLFLYTGDAMTLNLPFGNLMVRAEVPKKLGEFQLGTRWLSVAFAYDQNALAKRDASTPAQPGLPAERMRLTLANRIPVLNVDTGFSYNSSSGTLSAAISRELLVPNLRGTIQSTRSVRRTLERFGEESINVSYAVQF